MSPPVLKLTFDGTLREAFADDERRLARALTEAMAETAADVKQDFRSQVRAHFKRTPPYARRYGQNIDKATHADAYPNRRGKFSIDAAAVFRAVPAFLEKFTTGGEIVGAAGRLVIAFNTAKRKTLERSFRPSRKGGGHFYRKWSDIAAAERMFGKLLRIPQTGGDYLLAADKERAAAQGVRTRRRTQNFVPLFLVRRAVTMPQAFDFEGPVERATRDLPRRVDRKYRKAK